LAVSVTAVEGYARRLDVALQEVVDGLIATYLHGSAALGGFVPGRSDIDVLVVCGDRPIGRNRLTTAVQTLQSMIGGCPGRGVELSMVARRHVRDPGAPWPFVLPVSICAGEGEAAGRDPDLLMHYVACRAAGIALRGPAATELIGSVAPADVLAYLRAELAWALEQAPEAYGVLNACRALAYPDRDEVLSKIAGARYTLEPGAPQQLISGPLAMQRGDQPDHPPSQEAQRFIIEVGDALSA
jgi:Domain of unknown function (DUF4111)